MRRHVSTTEAQRKQSMLKPRDVHTVDEFSG
jgi:hypothetical protein